jgi:catechol 2,3-dioxygenase-like lactoylglutathione lyase family enzyme
MARSRLRSIVDDVAAAIAFYRDSLGFRVEMQPNAFFGMLSRADLGRVPSVPGGGPGPD